MEVKISEVSLNLNELTQDCRAATKHIVNVLFSKIYPLILRIRNKIQTYEEILLEDCMKIQDVYILCCNQIKKSILCLLEIFKLEYHQNTYLRESRQCNLERLSWCFKRLVLIEQKLDNIENNEIETTNDSLLDRPMYFVNWIDHTFQVLSKLSDIVYKTDFKDSEELYSIWENDMVECVSSLYITLDELLLSAMTLCRYCLPSDQLIVKARCQVVLREAKALLNELIDGDTNAPFKATVESLKLPIMPSNVNVLIDVLKDVLYVLETNTNTALLTLLVHCFSNNEPAINVLKDHFKNNTKGACPCHIKSEDDVTEDCSYVKDFDLYNERLMQIGSFAVSCSSDKNRILSVRSGLASLESLDPHLVPALMLSPESHHAALLVNTWLQEVAEIRDGVFLIVDPAAFAEKSKQMMHQKLLDIMKENCYDSTGVCATINIGSVLHEFFNVYEKCEPHALSQQDKLIPLISDLEKVLIECKIVSNLLASGDEFVYTVKKPHNCEVSFEKLLKRLKLLYTIVNRINSIFNDKKDDLFAFEGDEENASKNFTHTVYSKVAKTVNVNKKTNMSRSIFARTTKFRSSTRNIPLAKLTRHLNIKLVPEFSFSVELDKLCKDDEYFKRNSQSFGHRELSVLYNFSPRKNRTSLRKAVLNRHCQMYDKSESKVAGANNGQSGSLVDETTSLQITEILDEINNMSNTLPIKRDILNCTRTITAPSKMFKYEGEGNVLRIDVNKANATITKHIWNIPVNASTVEMALDDSASNISSATQPSNVTTLERINDLDLVESKLNSLKGSEETSL